MPAPPRASLSRQVSERASPMLPFRELAGSAGDRSQYFGGSGGGALAAQSPGGTNSRYEEAREAREKLEGARRENERLAAKVRELEGRLRERGRSKGGAAAGA